MDSMYGDFFAGAFSGASYVLSSHPFDTIKVRMQMGSIGLLKTI